jgi:hypothetical protein
MHLENSKTNKVIFIYDEAVKGLTPELLTKPNTLDWYKHIMSLPISLRTVYCIVVLETQVNNGGFDQYFSNLYGQFAFDTILMLRSIKAFEKAQLLIEALQVYNLNNLIKEDFVIWLTRRDWILQADNELLSNKTINIDKAYWNSKDDIVSLLGNYVENEK